MVGKSEKKETEKLVQASKEPEGGSQFAQETITLKNGW